MASPCMNCPHRKLVCHDHCNEYAEWNAALVEAKAALNKASKAVDYLVEMTYKRRKRVHKDK